MELLIRDYQELNGVSYSSNLHKMIHQISVVENIDPNILYEEEDIDVILNKYDKIKWINEPFKVTDTKDILKLKDLKLQIFDFNRITYGQFVDLEILINDYIQNIDKIVASIYLNANKEEFKEIQYENYSDIDINERASFIRNNISINDVYYNLDKYFKFRQNIFKMYSSIFSGDEDDIDPDDLTPEELKIYNEEIRRREKNKTNIWQDILDICADGSIINYDDVLNSNVYFVFAKLSRNKVESKMKQ